MPLFIEELVTEMIPKLQVEGVFRLTGNGDRVAAWKKKLDKGTLKMSVIIITN